MAPLARHVLPFLATALSAPVSTSLACNDHLGGHFLLVHTNLTVTLNDCKLALKDLSGEMFRHGQALHELLLCRDYCPVYQLVHSITAYYPVSNSYTSYKLPVNQGRI